MSYVVDDELLHYGIPRRSGRYPWGSGEDPYQHGRDFLGRIEELKKTGWKETPEKIMEEFGLTTTQYRIEKSIAKNERDALNLARAKSLREDGLGWTEIGKQMGVSESTVRGWFNKKDETQLTKARETADFLKKMVDEKGMIDVGAGTELELNISQEKLNTALYLLEREGYVAYSGRIPQLTNPGQHTTQKVLCPPDIKPKGDAKAPAEIYDYENIHSVKEYISRDGGETYEKKFTYPSSMDSKRLMIRYKEDGGIDKDGIVELRRDVADLSLGESRYSQVRILVDGTHYIKGMALYSDNMPDGVDVVFNTNKTKDVPMHKVLKEIKSDPDNPFGSAIKDADQGGQYWYDPKTGKRVSGTTPGAKLGLINKRADEGDWSDWKDALPSQFLSKQSKKMAEKQLNIAKTDKQAEFDEICALTNPTIKKHLLSKFADECDAAAVNLQAAALPGQKYHVIVPINSLKENEVYAPKYDNGTKLALIRYPHGGTFEIPILTVNNKHQQAIDLLGKDVGDVVGITSKVAERLSGADFDGDTVMCIPTHDRAGKVKITSTPKLKGLEGFDPKTEYGPDSYAGKEVRLMSKKLTQTQMGIISNLITDMTLADATDAEKAAAVRHSMVVIDAEKHKLDYKQSEIDNNIAALHEKYQGKKTGGAATIISRAKGEYSVDKRQGSAKVNQKGEEWYDPTRPEGSLIWDVADADKLYRPVTSTNKKTGIVTLTTADGKKIKYDPTDADAKKAYAPIKRVDKDTGEVTYTNRKGDIVYALERRTQKSTRMAETDDAYTLVSEARHPMEIVYADYANSMKALANRARMEVVRTGDIKYSKEAHEKYREEANSLNRKLNDALMNAPRERAAQRMANAEVNAKIASGQIDKSETKKAGQRALTKYRQELGTLTRKKRNIEITDREWEAIQKGAISKEKLKKILANTDVDKLRERATPRSTVGLSDAKISRIKALSASYTIAEIAEKFNISPSTVSKYLKGAN